MRMTWNAQPIGSDSAKAVLADCAPFCLLLLHSLLLAGGCILTPPLHLWPDLEHPFHKDAREWRLERDLANGWILDGTDRPFRSDGRQTKNAECGAASENLPASEVAAPQARCSVQFVACEALSIVLLVLLLVMAYCAVKHCPFLGSCS